MTFRRTLLASALALAAVSAASADDSAARKPERAQSRLAAGDSLGLLIFKNGDALPPSGLAAGSAQDLAAVPAAERKPKDR